MVATSSRARDGASRHRRRALVIGVVLASVPVVVATAPTTVSAESIAVFDYSMPSRYGMDGNGDGVIDSYVPTTTCAGETSATCTNHPATSAFPVQPTTWRVNFDACASNAVSYQWSVLSEPPVEIQEPKSTGDCDDFYADFPEEGTYRVGLRTRGAGQFLFGPTTWVDVVVQDWLVISMGDSYGSGEGAPDVPIDPNTLGNVAAAFDGLGAALIKLANFGPCAAGTGFNFDDCVTALENAGHEAVDAGAALIRRLDDPVCDLLDPGFNLLACGELLTSLAITIVTDIGEAVSNAYNDYANRFRAAFEAAQAVVNSFETLIENFERGAAWQDRRCHRSANAGAALAAKELEEIDPRTSVTLIHVACTGGMILQGILDTYVGAEDERESRLLPPIPPQVHQAAQLIGDREIDIVHFSVGGNDVNFAPMIFSCVLRVDCSDENINDDPEAAAELAASTVCPATDVPGVTLVTRPIFAVLCREFFASLAVDPLMGENAVELFRLGVEGDSSDPLRPGIANAYAQLNAALFRAPFTGGTPDEPIESGLGLPEGHNDRVYITEYVNPLLREDGGVCSQDVDGLSMIPGVSLVETTYLNNNTVDALTEVVRSNAQTHGWNFIGGIAEGFESASGQGHGYCADPDEGNVPTDFGSPVTQGRWMVRLQDAFLIQGNKMGGVHPNRSGYRHYANQILPAWLGNLYANPTTLSGPRSPNGDPVADAGPDLTLNEGDIVALDNNSADDGPLEFTWSSTKPLVATVNPLNIATPKLTAIDNGSSVVGLMVVDSGGGTATDKANITVLNVAPTVSSSSATVDEGSTYIDALSFSDPGTLDDHTATVNYGDGSPTKTLGSVDGSVPLSHRYLDNGTYTVTVTVTDDDDGVGTGTVDVTVLNVAPTLVSSTDADTIDEGSMYIYKMSFTDPGSLDTHSAQVDYGDDSDLIDLDPVSAFVPLSHPYVDDGEYTVNVAVTDNDGGTDTGTASVTVLNVAPVVGNVTGPIVPVLIGTAVNISAPFTDVGVEDDHTAAIDWGDAVTTSATLAQGEGSGTASGSKSYSSPGIYTVEVRVTDDDGATGSAQFLYVVVYDPAGGFVTGGGLIDSPAGAYVPDPSIAGPAHFAFISKYQKGASVPQGNTSFRFNAADFVFASISYEWLVVSGAKATYKGRGTVNGAGDYGFLLSTVDGDAQSVPGPDRLRLKVWDRLTGTVIYDNQIGATDDTAAATNIAAGAITVGAPKKK